MKPTSFEIPQGCTLVTIEQHDNKIITTFEPEVRFKDGDIVTYCGRIIILKNIQEKTYHALFASLGIDAIYANGSFGDNLVISEFILSPESLPIIQDALSKVGKVWNADKKCIEELKPKRWRAEHGKRYWFVTDTFSIIDHQDDIYCVINDIRYNIGNYFQTKQQAIDFAEQIKQLLI